MSGSSIGHLQLVVTQGHYESVYLLTLALILRATMAVTKSDFRAES